MKRAISNLFAFLVFVAGAFGIYNAKAQGLSFVTGERLIHTLSVCILKADAIEIAEAHRSGGQSAAEAVWQVKERCATVVVAHGEVVGKVVYAVKGLSVVEIVHDGKVLAYFMTSAPVNKPQNKA
jgi:hypothetical protein